MPQPFTCCPVGKVYDTLTGMCTTLNKLNPTDPIECPCCPPGYVYDSLTGECKTSVSPFLYTGTIECPCCPEGYVYVNTINPLYPNGFCLPDRPNVSNLEAIPTVPCLPCNCVEAIPVGCTDCGTDGLPITFDYDPMVKNCTDCEPQDENNPRGAIQDFLPPQFQDPITSTFRLRNKNFI